jgi:hypothetical protein
LGGCVDGRGAVVVVRVLVTVVVLDVAATFWCVAPPHAPSVSVARTTTVLLAAMPVTPSIRLRHNVPPTLSFHDVSQTDR